MSATPLTYKIVEPFAAAALPADITLPIPVPTQLPGTPGRASFDDGFPPANFLPTTAGGVPPSGKDFNGLLYMITAYLAFFQAGQRIYFDAAVEAAIGGYPVGAVVQSVTTPGLFFVNTVAANANDPDSVLTGWISSQTQYATRVLTAGNNLNLTLPGPSNYIIDYDTTAGAASIGGWIAQRNGQRVVACCAGANPLTIDPALGTAANRARLNGATTILQNDALTFEYNTTLARWVQI